MGSKIELSDETEQNLLIRVLARILACLLTYTIGSCNYSFCHRVGVGVNVNNENNEIQMEQLRVKHDDQEKEWKTRSCRADIRMKKRLLYHFKSHIGKWRDEHQRRFPWKLVLHVLLLIVVTMQVSLYAKEKFKVTSFMAQNLIGFKECYIISEFNKPVEDLYKFSDVYRQIEHVVETYYSVSTEAVNYFLYHHPNGPSRTPNDLMMTVEYTEHQQCFDVITNINAGITFPPSNDHLVISRAIYQPNATDLTDEWCTDNDTCCSMEDCDHSVMDQVTYFINSNNSYRIKEITFSFVLDAFYQIETVEHDNAIQAVHHVDVIISNDFLSSHMKVGVKLDSELKRSCDRYRRGTTLDIFVLIFSTINFILYIISAINLIKLLKDVKLHFLAYHKKQLSWRDVSALCNTWYLLTVFACFLLVVSIILKISSDYKVHISLSLIEAVSVILGIGLFLLWCGLFGFLHYFETLNVLLITIKLALPSILRFAVCMFIFFMAFMFCGWLVIGPYNPQFKDPLSTAENLISFLNGDGLGQAFTTVSWSNPFVSVLISVYNKIYLILFIFIFIYIVLSLFIGIFDHAYDSLSDNWKGRSRGFVRDWAEGEPDDDLTKNYPFPVPRVRDELGDLKCTCDSHQTTSVPNEQDENNDVMENHEDTSKSTVFSNGSIDVHNNYTGDTILRTYSDSKVPSPTILLPVPTIPRRVKSQRDYDYKNDPIKCNYCELKIRQQRRYTDVKSTAREPPNASFKDVAKARFKIQFKESQHQMKALEEGDI